MEHMSLIKPDFLSGSRMNRKRVADLLCPQRIFSFPLTSDFVLLTVCLDPFLILRLKNYLPRNVESGTIIPDIHDFLLAELILDSLINSCCDSNCISNRCFSSLVSGLHAEECQIHRPIALIRILIVVRNAFGGWIICCRVHTFRDLCTHSCSINVIQFLVKKAVDHGLEPSLSVDIETAEKNRTVLHYALLDSLAVLMTPINEADSVPCGLNEHGECAIGIQGCKRDVVI